MNVSVEAHAQIDKKMIVNIDMLCNVSVVEWHWTLSTELGDVMVFLL